MKLLLVLLACLLGLSSAMPQKNLGAMMEAFKHEMHAIKPAVRKEFALKMLPLLQNPKARASGITAVVNEFVDKICVNVHDLIINNGLDPLELPDLNLNLVPAGVINMTHGWLQDTSTISRYEDVVVSYSTTTRLLEMSIPIKFDALQFTYDYLVKALLLGIDGTVEGKVENLKINMKLDFDFNTYQAQMSKFDITDTGSFSVHFSGNGLLDWLINAMTSVVTFVLHPIIVDIIQLFVTTPVNMVVDVVNQILDSILHPETPPAIFEAMRLFN